jgi:hypothetical protein
MMKNICLLVAGFGFAQFDSLIWRRLLPRFALWGISYAVHAEKIDQSIALLVVSNRSAEQTCFLSSIGKGGFAAFASRASVTPFCGVLEV